jgi:hypothetical protein
VRTGGKEALNKVSTNSNGPSHADGVSPIMVTVLVHTVFVTISTILMTLNDQHEEHQHGT